MTVLPGFALAIFDILCSIILLIRMVGSDQVDLLDVHGFVRLEIARAVQRGADRERAIERAHEVLRFAGVD